MSFFARQYNNINSSVVVAEWVARGNSKSRLEKSKPEKSKHEKSKSNLQIRKQKTGTQRPENSHARKKNRSGKYPRTEISRNGISEDLQKWKSPEMEISKMEISRNGIVRNVPPQNVYPPKWHSTKCLPSNVSPKYIPLQSSASPMHFLCIPNVFPILPTRIAYYEGRRRRYRVGLVRIPENDDQFPLGI